VANAAVIQTGCHITVLQSSPVKSLAIHKGNCARIDERDAHLDGPRSRRAFIVAGEDQVSQAACATHEAFNGRHAGVVWDAGDCHGSGSRMI